MLNPKTALSSDICSPPRPAFDGAVIEHVHWIDGVFGLKVDGGPARLLRHDRLVGGDPLVKARLVREPSTRALTLTKRVRDRVEAGGGAGRLVVVGVEDDVLGGLG